MEQGSFNEILSVTREIFFNPPFHDLCNRALLLCLDYLIDQMQKPENRNNPSQMAELAKILAGYLQDNWILTEIILFDQYKKGLAKEADLLSALEHFPDDLLLRQITAEHLIYNGKAEQALPIIEEALESGIDDNKLMFLHMIALDQMEHRDEAAELFRQLVEQSEFDVDLLADYFSFCRKNERRNDMLNMAEKLENVSDDKLKPFADFFRAAVLLQEDNDAKKQEALKLLVSTPNDNPEFTFYAANTLCEADMLDEAEAKYMAIRDTYSIPSLIYVNLSELYDSRDETEKALAAAKHAFDMEKTSMLPAFIYAQRLSEAKRYEEAVSILNFPRHAVNYREDVVELWTDCMHHVIENSIAGERYMQAEEQCKHLLTISPDDAFGKENLEKVRKLIRQQSDKGHPEQTAPAA